MTYDAFISQFRALTVAEVNDNASYIYKSMKDRYNEGVYFKVEIVENGTYSFQIDKTPERSFTENVQEVYSYPEATLQLGQIVGSSCRRLQGIRSSRRTLFKQYDLTPGVYVAFAKVNFNPTFEKDFEVNLAVYAEYACDIEVAPRNLVIQYTGNANVKWNPEEHQSKRNWNDLGNTTYRHGNSGWGNNNNNNNNNNGWGNDNPNNNNNGWGSYFEKGNNNNNNGWGNDNPNPNNNNNGWGNNNNNNNNNGWGDYFEQPKPQPPPQPGNNNGWGSYF